MKAVDPTDEENSSIWIDMARDRLASVTGVAIDTLDGDGCEEVSKRTVG